ncbi:hypothetical protein JCM5353_004931, partial [Sporobolomyces roseus]
MTTPSSPATKTVSFASSHQDPSPSSQPSSSTSLGLSSPSSTSTRVPSPPPSSTSASTSSSSNSARPQPKRRRSSIKQGLQMPYKPPSEYYTHRDPLLRRLRLRNGFGTMVDLEKEFRDTKVVLFFFGATWRGSSNEPFELVANFQRRFPHQSKVVFVSIDDTLAAYDLNTKRKNWLSMEWNDGSTLGDPSSTTSSDEPLPSPPLEPFLLAGDPDLEEDTSLSSPPSRAGKPHVWRPAWLASPHAKRAACAARQTAKHCRTKEESLREP